MRSHRRHPLAPQELPADVLRAENANALRHDGFANAAISCAAFGLAATVGSLALLGAPNGNIRASLGFWVLVVLYAWWMSPVLNFKARALGRLPITLLLAPLGCAAATACAAAGFVLRDSGGATTATPLTLGWLTAVSALLCGAGYLALRESALPGGGTKLVPLPIAPLARSAIADTSLLQTTDADGEPRTLTTADALAAAPLWGILGSTWFAGMTLNFCWFGALLYVVLPAPFEVPVAVAALLFLLASFVVYLRCYRGFGKSPTVATRNALARFFAGTILAFAALACLQAFYLSQPLGGEAKPSLGLDAISYGLALVPACAVGYALYRLMHLDLEALARDGFRR